MRFALLALLAISAQAQTLKSLAATGTGTFSPSNWPNGATQYEFRLHGLSLPVGGADVNVWNLNASSTTIHYCKIAASTSNLLCFFYNDSTPSGIPSISLAGRTDVRVRYTHYPASAATSTIEIWNGDGSGYAISTTTIGQNGASSFTGTMSLAASGLNLAFWRATSSPVATGGTCPADAPAAAANLADFLFDSGVADRSGNGYTLSGAGTTLVNSPTYPPQAAIGGWNTFYPQAYTGVPFSLSGSGSSSCSGDGTIASYYWSVTSGPATPIISSRTSSTPTITFPVTGSYVVRLTVTDSAGGVGYTETTIGAVTKDSNNVVIPPLTSGAYSEFDQIIGQVKAWGTADWLWYDKTLWPSVDVAYANQMGSLGDTDGTALNGGAARATITLAGNSGSDGAICCNPIVNVTGLNPTTDLTDNQSLWLWWDRDGDGSNAGRFNVSIQAGSRTSSSFRLADYYWPVPQAKSASMNISARAANSWQNNGTSSSEPSTSHNYYEAALAMARLYRKTGQQQYLTNFRAFCDRWAVWAAWDGYRVTNARNEGFHFLLACAADNYPRLWNELNQMRSTASLGVYDYYQQTTIASWATPVSTAASDVRSSAFSSIAWAMWAKYWPAHAPDATAARTNACTLLARQVDNVWSASKATIGTNYVYWPEDLFAQNTSYPAASIPPGNGTFGTSPWRSAGLPIIAFGHMYEAFGPSICNDATRQATVLDLMTKAGNFLWDYARAPAGGVFYNVLYASSQGYEFGKTPVLGAGTVTATNGSATIAGSGTSFTSAFACNGTDYIAIDGGTWRQVYRVESCASNTSLTINIAHNKTTQSGRTYWKAYGATTACGAQTLASTCEIDPYDGGPGLAHDIAIGLAWLYQLTGNATWKDRFERIAGQNYGGSDIGPWDTATGSGPYSTSRNNFDQLLSACGTPPCVSPGSRSVGYGQGPKPLGFTAGVGRFDQAMVYRVGATAPTYRTFNWSVNLGGASSAVVRVIRPSGETVTSATCTSGLCSVDLDTRQGQHLYCIEKRNGGGQRISGCGGISDYLAVNP